MKVKVETTLTDDEIMEILAVFREHAIPNIENIEIKKKLGRLLRAVYAERHNKMSQEEEIKETLRRR